MTTTRTPLNPRTDRAAGITCAVLGAASLAASLAVLMMLTPSVPVVILAVALAVVGLVELSLSRLFLVTWPPTYTPAATEDRH